MAAPPRLHGVLVIDKPNGPTSHDVVARLRKVLGTRAIGHAGTLDPSATGVLVVAVGEATKLSPYLTAQAKEYLATIAFGASTSTLDAEGEVVEEGPIPDELGSELLALMRTTPAQPSNGTPWLERALAIERARTEQVPPIYSAIKTGGQTAHQLARRGKDVTLAPRAVSVERMEVTEAGPTTLGLRVLVSKGYYVRALARDLGRTLGVPSHLASLRRVASGSFTLDEAIAWSAAAPEIACALQTVERAAARVLPASHLSEEGERRARFGQPLVPAHFLNVPAEALSAWFGPRGELIAIGRPGPNGCFAVERGFTHATSTAST